MMLDGSAVVVRHALSTDLPAMVALLANDRLGALREMPTPAGMGSYLAAFESIDKDPAHQLLVCEHAGELVAMAQLSFIPGLSRGGSWRAQIEAVRTRADYRGRGLGREFIWWAIGQARTRGCSLVQLTTDKSRTEAHRFYAQFGFTASHEGLKLLLD
ncbi:GNAT family N-acetyltransferase [Paeniglutamicibacter gangotriensis]|uniref:GNAT family N-acetyltransferase n=1 Tax=Paeniglutamicibacter gangotriensis TaxID=254787 RepID=A0A5B0E3Y5_9MICC|nr:GNAT family N-acetyltransferase [Paeniglutamicibacter gangotriensis]KAA0973767.1 GNAT family N-acetyltransferase [Paeniglutamicibacter gangotriensis]